ALDAKRNAGPLAGRLFLAQVVRNHASSRTFEPIPSPRWESRRTPPMVAEFGGKGTISPLFSGAADRLRGRPPAATEASHPLAGTPQGFATASTRRHLAGRLAQLERVIGRIGAAGRGGSRKQDQVMGDEADADQILDLAARQPAQRERPER